MDDHETMVRIICNLLKQIDVHDVDEATDGAGAKATLRAGVSSHIVKPFNAETLRTKIEKVLDHG